MPADLLVLITTGPRLYREYLLRSIAGRYPVHLITTTEPTWETPYLDGFTVLPRIDAGTAVATVRELAAHRTVAGVLTWNESHTVHAALAARAIGRPGPLPTAALRCRDKFGTRTALAAHGVPQPRFELVADVHQAEVAAKRLGYPVVLKPRAGVASEGVVRVDDVEQLADHFEASRGRPADDVPVFVEAVLVEEYLQAPEISVDCIVRHGRVTPIFLARKEIGFAPFFEETGHLVDGADPLPADPGLLDVLRRTHAALEYTDGWTHTELKLTATGPAVIEVNGRLGGDLIPYLGLLATGIDPGLVAAAVAAGQAPPLTPSRASVAGIRFFYPPWPDAVVRSVTFAPGEQLPEVDLMLPLVEGGDVISPPGKGLMDGRIALATAVAGTAAACTAALDRAEATLDCHWAPRPEGP